MSDPQDTLSNLMHEERRFEPPAELAEHANLKAEAYQRATDDRLGFWAEAAERLDWCRGRRAARLGAEVGPGPRLGRPAVRQVVRRRQAQRGVQLCRPARRGRPR
ncbi:hypothetical protein NOCA280038 [metagenome]|uniref:Acetyl-coenzyme A synthetase N-terminal domain-containing protein n=1 Tax=metagenome TaxID=256318 RepID=A0A2P2CF41_9ZZZZ